eukprot:Sspe_Gene.96849::Locus_70238_Transcript_1_1_Confidence_1.000_Length_1458::g.96849::m.96849
MWNHRQMAPHHRLDVFFRRDDEAVFRRLRRSLIPASSSVDVVPWLPSISRGASWVSPSRRRSNLPWSCTPGRLMLKVVPFASSPIALTTIASGSSPRALTAYLCSSSSISEVCRPPMFKVRRMCLWEEGLGRCVDPDSLDFSFPLVPLRSSLPSVRTDEAKLSDRSMSASVVCDKTAGGRRRGWEEVGRNCPFGVVALGVVAGEESMSASRILLASRTDLEGAGAGAAAAAAGGAGAGGGGVSLAREAGLKRGVRPRGDGGTSSAHCPPHAAAVAAAVWAAREAGLLYSAERSESTATSFHCCSGRPLRTLTRTALP